LLCNACFHEAPCFVVNDAMRSARPAQSFFAGRGAIATTVHRELVAILLCNACFHEAPCFVVNDAMRSARPAQSFFAGRGV